MMKYMRTRDGKRERCDFSHAWVRSIGPVTVVMLRFATSDYSMRRLLRFLPKTIRRQTSLLTLTVHRADRPWALDHTLSMAAFHSSLQADSYGRRLPLAAVARGNLRERAQTLRPDLAHSDWDDWLATFLSNIAGDPQLDIALCDWFLTREAMLRRDTNRSNTNIAAVHASKNLHRVACFRVFDLARRGDRFIEHHARSAARNCWSVPRYPPNPQSCYWNLVRDDHSESYSAMSRRMPIARVPASARARAPWFGYLLYHGADSQGLLSYLINFIRKEHPTGAPLGPRHILRASSRAFGSEAIVLLVVPLKSPEEARLLTASLRDELAKYHRRRRPDSRASSGAVPHPGYWHAEIREFRASPSVGFDSRTHSILRPDVLIRQNSLIITKVASCISRHNERATVHTGARICYSNARIQRNPLSTNPLTFLIGLGIALPKRRSTRDLVKGIRRLGLRESQKPSQ